MLDLAPDSVGSEERQIICECGIIFNHKTDVEWHRTTPGHI